MRYENANSTDLLTRGRRLPGWLVLTVGIVLTACPGPVERPTESPPAAGEEVLYELRLMDRKVGELRMRMQAGSGTETWHSRFSFRDRGRGPTLQAQATVDEHGLLTEYRVSGTDYWNAPVEETLVRDAGSARWKNGVDDGQAPADKPAFYVSLQSTFADTALLARALLRAEANTLALLPAGEARIRAVSTVQVSRTPGATDRDEVTLYAISGTGYAPDLIWLDSQKNLFAYADGWMTLIRSDWKSAIPDLRDRQKAASEQHLRKAAEQVPYRPTGELAFRNVALFDSVAKLRRENMTVVISGERITRVGPEGSIELTPGSASIDASGHTLVPGLWDMHTHSGAEDGVFQIAAGITSMRDLANDIDEIRSIQSQFDSGQLIGPRLVLAGFMDGTSEYTGPTKVIVDTEEQARAAIDRYKSLGYQQIKVYSSIKPALVTPIVEHAHKQGLRVSGHIPAFMTAEQAVRQGYDEIQHVNFLILNFLFDKVQDTRTPARFTAVGEHAANLDLDSPEVQAFVDLLVERKVVIDPTVTIFEDMFTARKGRLSPSYAAIADVLPVTARRHMLVGGLPVTADNDQRYRDSFQTMLRLVGMMHAKGVQVVAGTDGLAGYTLHRELELYVQAGISAPDVLHLATLGSAQLSRRASDLGSIEPGKLADMVLVAGRPSKQISDIRRTALTIKGGVLYSPKKLYQSLSIRHPTATPELP